MALAQEVIEAPDRESVQRLVDRSSSRELSGAVEPLHGVSKPNADI